MSEWKEYRLEELGILQSETVGREILYRNKVSMIFFRKAHDAQVLSDIMYHRVDMYNPCACLYVLAPDERPFVHEVGIEIVEDRGNGTESENKTTFRKSFCIKQVEYFDEQRRIHSYQD